LRFRVLSAGGQPTAASVPVGTLGSGLGAAECAQPSPAAASPAGAPRPRPTSRATSAVPYLAAQILLSVKRTEPQHDDSFRDRGDPEVYLAITRNVRI
jgi:hypothetical protein